jgi:hypothetical protein
MAEIRINKFIDDKIGKSARISKDFRKFWRIFGRFKYSFFKMGCMAWFTALVSFIWTAIVFVFANLFYWLSIFFVIPFKNFEILWVIIPVWINMIFSDFFQEKKGTSIGNALSNGAVMLWVGIDWTRFLVRALSSGKAVFSWIIFLDFFLCIIAVVYSIVIIYLGVRSKPVVKKIARIREISYVMLVFSPVIYGIVQVSWKYALVSIVFFPVFYLFFEILDRYLPDVIPENEM